MLVTEGKNVEAQCEREVCTTLPRDTSSVIWKGVESDMTGR